MVTKTSYLSMSSDQIWSLHVPFNTYQKSSHKKTHLSVGASGHRLKVNLRASPPSSSDYVTKIKLVTREGIAHAGPFIGILTVQRGEGFKGNKKNFIDIINTAKELGAFVFVFTVEEMNWDRLTTGAYIYHQSKGEWIHLNNFPLPNVVYNRIPYREDEQQPYVQSALKRLAAIPELHLYNFHFFNKWNLYQVLSKDPQLNEFIPESLLLKEFGQLQSMVGKHRLLYLKPVDGNAGKGIMSIVCLPTSYLLKIPSEKRILTRSFPTLRALWDYVLPRVKSSYVLQQGVTLLKHNNRPFDIRVLVQKDGLGLWRVSGIGIRVAGENGITTHVPCGGSIAAPEQVLLPLLGEEKYPVLMKRLSSSVLELASAIESHFSLLGEMSMDIGVTKDGKLWFFEANSKPMKFDEPHIRRTSLQRIIQYAHYLSNFTPKGVQKDAGQTSHT